MKKIFSILFIQSICFSVSAQQKTSANTAIQNALKALSAKEQSFIGKPFPAFSEKINQAYFTDNDLKGKVVLVNFWFADCRPCLLEFNALNELNKKLSADKNFELIAFTFETPKVIEEIRQQYHLNFKIISVSQSECARLNQKSGFPTNVITDKNGIIRYWKSGGETTEEKANEFVTDSLFQKIQNEL